jgi:hypothetical protein
MNYKQPRFRPSFEIENSNCNEWNERQTIRSSSLHQEIYTIPKTEIHLGMGDLSSYPENSLKLQMTVWIGPVEAR